MSEGLEGGRSHADFTKFDPLSFVAFILNFIREVTAPLLASGGRHQVCDVPSSE